MKKAILGSALLSMALFSSFAAQATDSSTNVRETAALRQMVKLMTATPDDCGCSPQISCGDCEGWNMPGENGSQDCTEVECDGTTNNFTQVCVGG